MKVKLFICHHPGSLLLYKNLIQIIRKYDKDTKIILFKVNHPYFRGFNFGYYGKYFDEIREFHFIDYQKNFLKGFWKILIFQKKLKMAISNLLLNFEKIDLFLDDSAYLPINIFLYNLSKQKNIKNIIKFRMTDPELSYVKTDKLKTFLCNLYSFPFGHYKIKAISTLGGKFLNYIYVDKIPGIVFKIGSPILSEENNLEHKGKNILPYPVSVEGSEGSSAAKKDMIIVLGKKSVFNDLSEYLPDYKIYVKKLTVLFDAIGDKYLDCELYYKPHPVDKGQIMPGIDTKKYNLFDDSVNTQILIDKYRTRIKAIYAFSSSSLMSGSFFGISSYSFYRYLCNQAGTERFNSYFNQNNLKSRFLYHISDLEEIGKIDKLERPKIDSEKLEKIYRKVLNV
ncbi:MAG: hypothetical protein ABIG40_01615 [Parcubacteria group bacterium]